MGGAFYGRKLARRRREDSPDAPRAGREGGWGCEGVSGGGANGGAACLLRPGRDPPEASPGAAGRGCLQRLGVGGWEGDSETPPLSQAKCPRKENGSGLDRLLCPQSLHDNHGHAILCTP